jgi:hypothetical protein
VAAGPGDCEHEGSQRAWLAGIWGVEGSALWVFFERQRKWGFFSEKKRWEVGFDPWLPRVCGGQRVCERAQGEGGEKPRITLRLSAVGSDVVLL